MTRKFPTLARDASCVAWRLAFGVAGQRLLGSLRAPT